MKIEIDKLQELVQGFSTLCSLAEKGIEQLRIENMTPEEQCMHLLRKKFEEDARNGNIPRICKP
jgi:hypothetical protein